MTESPPKQTKREQYATLDPAAQAKRLASRARADNTQVTYSGAQRHYFGWLNDRGLDRFTVTAEQFAEYLCHLAVECQHTPRTVQTKKAAIARFYRDAMGVKNVTQSDYVKSVFRGIQREFADRPVQCAPLLPDMIHRILTVLAAETGPKVSRDRALVLIGFAGAFRRSELTSLRMEDVRFEKRGVVLLLRSSKTDQIHAGKEIGISPIKGDACPVAALDRWLSVAGPGEYVFRPVTRWGFVKDDRLSDRSVGRVVKALVKKAGGNPDEYAAHSLRSGLITALCHEGLSDEQVRAQSRHASSAMLQVYNLREVFDGHNYTALSGLGETDA